MPVSYHADQSTIEARAAELREARVPYAVATIVRTVSSTAAKPGDKAIILADGSLAEGFLGGGCVKGAVGKAAVDALADGAPTFISLRPEEVLAAEGIEAGAERDGVRFARNGCPSKGSVDIFVEPVLPKPELIICGQGPVALALARLAAGFGFGRRLAAKGLAPETTSGAAEHLSEGFDWPETNGERFIVVATQGAGDLAALSAALTGPADYVSFVGSRRKFAALAEKLAADFPAKAVASVKAPAGLDISAITPDEIALSILAEITQARRSARRGAAE
ncbi:MAG: XdhC family protein [Pseudomonadota bacterium]